MRRLGLGVALCMTLVGSCSDVTEPPPTSAGGGSSGTSMMSVDSTGMSGVSLDELSGRAAHTATRLPDGKVLVAGGCVTDGCTMATAETFIVAGDGTSFINGPEMAGPRDGHTATSLTDGRVVLIAGYSGEGRPPLASVESFDPASGDISALADLNQGRGGHAAALISGDRVLVVGGWIDRGTFTSSVEIVDVSSGSANRAADLPVALHAMDAVTLSDGRVLVTGGETDTGVGTDRAWIYDETSDSWSETGEMADRRFKHYAVLLEDSRVLVIGGTTDDKEILSTTEIYDPVTGLFVPGPDLVEPRYKLPGGAVVLPGNLVVVGGGGTTVEVIDLDEGTSSVLEDLGVQGSFATTTPLGDDLLLILGGYDRQINLRGEFVLIEIPTT